MMRTLEFAAIRALSERIRAKTIMSAAHVSL